VLTTFRNGITVAVLALSTATCTDAAPGPRAAANATRVLLTDGPFPYNRIARVDLYVVSVSASLTPDTGSSAGFTTLVTPNRRINVLALQKGATDELGTAALPTGVITAVRMVIDTDSSSITLKDGRKLSGTSSPGIDWQSSAGKPVLNALIHEQISVPDAGGVVVIDYDVGQAFIPRQELDPTSTDSGFIFSPVLRAADATRTGSISGVVRAHSASGAPVADASLRLYLGNPSDPEDTWPVLATAKSDAAGAFKFSYVTRSAWWSAVPAQAGKTYIVAADPPSNSGLGRKLVANLVVTAGSDTEVGAVVLP
jgi:Domain of unknown function (DUF4382)